MTIKEERTRQALRDLAAQFISEQSNRTSLITVTNVELGNRGKNATVWVTVMPEKEEAVVSEFLDRKRIEMRNFLKGKIQLRVLPHFEFVIDLGEKNRQKIDRIIYEDQNR